jgi:hypothetical protein
VAKREVTSGETTSPVDEKVATENYALAPCLSTPPIVAVAAATTLTAARIERMFAMKTPSRIRHQTADRVLFSRDQHQDCRTDPVKLAMAMSARSVLARRTPSPSSPAARTKTPWNVFRSMLCVARDETSVNIICRSLFLYFLAGKSNMTNPAIAAIDARCGYFI